MAVRDVMTEHCDDCEAETEHDVELSLKEGRSSHGRTPTRVAVCRVCGAETSIQMDHR